MSSATCGTCYLDAHSLFHNYKSLAALLGRSYGTIKTWASLTNTYVQLAHPNPEIGWNMLRRAVNALPMGAPLILYVPSGGQAARAFRPLPLPLEPGRYLGCVAAAWVHRNIIIGPYFDRKDFEAAINSRRGRPNG